MKSLRPSFLSILAVSTTQLPAFTGRLYKRVNEEYNTKQNMNEIPLTNEQTKCEHKPVVNVQIGSDSVRRLESQEHPAEGVIK